MIGWLALLLLILTLGLALLRGRRVDRAMVQLGGAALLLALAGYAWQGRPGLAGAPVGAAARARQPETAFAALRPLFFERFDASARWLIIADSYQRRGDTEAAVGVVRAGLRGNPRSVALWTGLGNALVLHGGGAMNPAADLAYRRAAALSPAHPAPRFFYGLSLIQSGDVPGAARLWRALLAEAPADAGWRAAVADRLAILDALEAIAAARR